MRTLPWVSRSEPLGHYSDAVQPAVGQPLDDRAHQGVHYCLEPDAPPQKLLGDERERGARGFADAHRKMPGSAAHRDDEVPARRGLGVHHEVLHDLDAVVTRGLEAERIHVRRQVEIVVDGLRHMHDLEPPRGLLLQLHGRIGGIVTADGDELRNVEAQQRQHRAVEKRRVLGGVGARDPDVRPAAKVDPAHLADVEGGHVIDVALHDPLEAVAHPEHIDSLQPCPDGGRADDAVDPRCRPAAHQDRQCPPLGHRRVPPVTRTGRAACATRGPGPPLPRSRSTTRRPCRGAPPARST